MKDTRLPMINGLDTIYLRDTTLAVNVLLEGKWRVQILCVIRFGPVRLGQLARLIPGASKKTLTKHLRQLETDGIIVRRDLSDRVLHIEYELTDAVRDGVYMLLDHLAKWGNRYLDDR